MPHINCPVCSADFQVNPTYLLKSPNVCCSRKCASAFTKRFTADRFWKKVNKTETCWLWTGCKNNQGYGDFRGDNGNILAHRYSWILHFGPIADGLFVCHHCDTPACLKPDHLFLGTPLDNNHDAIGKGRMDNRGAQNGQSKLNDEKVAAIRSIFASGNRTKRSIAKEFGVSDGLIAYVVKRRGWLHVP